MNFVVATITPIGLQNISYGTYLLFMAFMIVGALWAWFLLPELKNKTLEEVSSCREALRKCVLLFDLRISPSD
jgi:hypothetical protein